MKDIGQFARDVDIFGNIMMVKFESLLRKEVLNVRHRPCQEVVHTYDMIAFFQKTVTQVRPDESGRAGD